MQTFGLTLVPRFPSGGRPLVALIVGILAALMITGIAHAIRRRSRLWLVVIVLLPFWGTITYWLFVAVARQRPHLKPALLLVPFLAVWWPLLLWASRTRDWQWMALLFVAPPSTLLAHLFLWPKRHTNVDVK